MCIIIIKFPEVIAHLHDPLKHVNFLLITQFFTNYEFRYKYNIAYNIIILYCKF